MTVEPTKNPVKQVFRKISLLKVLNVLLVLIRIIDSATKKKRGRRGEHKADKVLASVGKILGIAVSPEVESGLGLAVKVLHKNRTQGITILVNLMDDIRQLVEQLEFSPMSNHERKIAVVEFFADAADIPMLGEKQERRLIEFLIDVALGELKGRKDDEMPF